MLRPIEPKTGEMERVRVRSGDETAKYVIVFPKKATAI